jgi:iron complex outermembrane receptor protein
MKNVYQHFSRMLLILVALVWSSQAFAQGRTVTGKVTSAEDGEGLPGVNILIKGTSTGAVTDFDGNFSLSVSNNDVLVFSFIGFVSQEVLVGSQSVIDVSLASDVTTLSEIVVTGYGTQEKKEVTSSISSVKEEDFNRGMVNSPAQLIQGKVPGLTITKPGGNPNDGYTIRLRGVTTFGANQEPLIVVDGLVGADLNSVDPADIASIDVLKDGSAAAIYGTRGSSGVILVTTKSGKKGTSKVDYNGSVAFDNVANVMTFMTPAEYKSQPGAVDLGSETDFLDEVTQTGVSSIHNLSMSGGAAGTTYRASINFRDVQGIAINTGFQQINGRLNLSQKALNDKATFTANLAYTTRESEYGFNEVFRNAILSNPTLPVLFDGSAGLTNIGGYAERDVFDYWNPVSIAEQGINDGTDVKTVGQLRFEYDFSDLVDGLRLSLNYSQQYSNGMRGTYFSKTMKFGDGSANSGNASRRVDQSKNELFETTLDWIGSAGSTDITVLAGYSFQDFFYEGFGMDGGQFLTDAFTYNRMGASQDFDNGLGNVFSYANTNRLIAFFGRVNLNIDNTFFVSVSARQEGSSRFGENNKWGLFPAASAGIDFTQLANIGGFENLKLRVSYGRTGALPGESYLSLQRFGPQGNFFYNGAYVPSYGPISNPNPDLAWETKDEINLGVDFLAVNSKLSGSVEVYTRTVTDMILPINVPVPPNLFGQTQINIGELSTKGLEVALNYDVIDNGNLTYSTGLNFATFNTVIESLSSGSLSFGEGGVLYRAGMGSPGQNDTELVRVKEGEPLGDLWGPVWDGVTLDAAGVPVFTDLNGDGSFCNCDDDRTVIGNGLPDFTLGWNNSLTFGGGWDLNLFFRGAFGHDLLNSYRGFYENLESTTIGTWNIVNTDQFNPEVKKAVVNSTHVEDASFFRLDNASLGYNFDMSNSDAFNTIRLYVSGQNLFTITNYSGIDPEVRYGDAENNNDPLAAGIERRNTYFTSRTITVGLNLGF